MNPGRIHTFIETVGVIGIGTMGPGIAQAFAESGHRVICHDISEPALERGMRCFLTLHV